MGKYIIFGDIHEDGSITAHSAVCNGYHTFESFNGLEDIAPVEVRDPWELLGSEPRSFVLYPFSDSPFWNCLFWSNPQLKRSGDYVWMSGVFESDTRWVCRHEVDEPRLVVTEQNGVYILDSQYATQPVYTVGQTVFIVGEYDSYVEDTSRWIIGVAETYEGAEALASFPNISAVEILEVPVIGTYKNRVYIKSSIYLPDEPPTIWGSLMNISREQCSVHYWSVLSKENAENYVAVREALHDFIELY